MRMRVAIVILLVLGAFACKGGSAPTGPAVVPGAPAGDVTEVSGDVHATRDGKTRAIAKGDVVAGDDVIATGDDGRVTIVLRHNQVPWSLGPNKSKKVGDSAAWAAAKGAKAEDVTDDHSAAAGRHAERSATETAASMDNASGAGSASGGGSAPPDLQAAQQQLAAAKDDEERAKVQAELEAAQKAQQEQRVTATKGHVAPKCDPGDPLCDDGVATPGGPSGGGEVEGGLDRDAILRVMRAHAADFRRCYETLLKTAPDALGKISLHLTIGADGKVSAATVDGDPRLQPMFACAQKAATKLVFPRPPGTISISYPIVFSAP